MKTSGNPVSKLVEKSINCLEEACKELEQAGTPAPVEFLTSIITRIQTVSQVHLADLGNVPAVKPIKKHPLENTFYKIWHNKFPQYGTPSRVDRAEVGRMFKEIITPTYPHANEVFLERVIIHFAQSTVKWVKENKEIHVLAKNFRKFVNGPVDTGDDYNTIVVPNSDSKTIVI